MKAKHKIFCRGEKDNKPNFFGIQDFLYKNYYEFMLAVDDFLTKIGPDKIISINTNMSDERIIVWYWEE